MQSSRKLLIGTLLITCACSMAIAGSGTVPDTTQQWYGLVQSVKDVLTGTFSGKTGVGIAAGAQLAIQDTMVSLSDVVKGKDARHSLIEDSKNNAASIHLKVNDPEDAAYLILGTHPEPAKAPRYHTVVFMKDAKGGWFIESWHTSH